ncbi:hypothetical protein M3201_03355 [Paenibacillus motobuensis]|uniref:YfjL-like protein n=1 Tax=Paenibacillus TaxID=44249 RepID=UPI00203FF531|nr:MULTISPECIES: hypothetical protein [Paenibacillus]MCM3038738.1 hypothetical protein [Paenibacillus lutimineralis]MCM3645842.1 hypothetical protein [Paenibacillus motobuensis]
MKKTISIVIAVLLVSFVYYLYVEIEGLPWKHAEVKRKAIEYMKQKYSMDVAAEGSSYNFKFKIYTAKVHNVKDANKAIIRVDDDGDFDDEGNYIGKRLQDDYTLVYWSTHIRDSLQKQYPDLFKLQDIDTIQIEYTYYTLSLERGLSGDKDQHGVFIPAKSKDIPELSIRLKTIDIGDQMLEQLRQVINDMVNTSQSMDVFVRASDDHEKQEEGMLKTAILHIEHDKLRTFHSIEELKKEIKNW